MKRRPIDKLNVLAGLAGVKLNWNRRNLDKVGHYTYDGRDIACANMPANIVIHEIAHYVIATPKARTKINYGLGNLAGWSVLPRLYTDKQGRYIEDQAIGLTFHYCREIGLSSKETVERFAIIRNGKLKPFSTSLIDEAIVDNQNTIAKFGLERLCYNSHNSITLYKFLRGIK